MLVNFSPQFFRRESEKNLFYFHFWRIYLLYLTFYSDFFFCRLKMFLFLLLYCFSQSPRNLQLFSLDFSCFLFLPTLLPPFLLLTLWWCWGSNPWMASHMLTQSLAHSKLVLYHLTTPTVHQFLFFQLTNNSVYLWGTMQRVDICLQWFLKTN